MLKTIVPNAVSALKLHVLFDVTHKEHSAMFYASNYSTRKEASFS